MFEVVPSEVVLEILQFLPLQEYLSSSLVCQSWNHIVNSDTASTHIYRNHCFSLLNRKLYLHPDVTFSYIEWKRLLKTLVTMMNEEFGCRDVICRGIEASTRDNGTQDIHETRASANHRFWSSKGTESDESNEWCLYQFQKPNQNISDGKYTILYLDSAKVRFFLSSWQHDNIYSSKRVNFEFSMDKKTTWVKTNDFSCDCVDNVQSFPLGFCFIYPETIESERMAEPDWSDHDVFTNLIRDVYAHLLESNPNSEPREQDIFPETRKRMKLEVTNIKKMESTQGSMFVKVNYLGKVNQQPEDSLYFTCVNTFGVNGKVLHH
jgi:hypothetical protein